MIEAFQRWIERFGSRPWEADLKKAFEAGYRAGMKHDQTMATKSRTPNLKRDPNQLAKWVLDKAIRRARYKPKATK